MSETEKTQAGTGVPDGFDVLFSKEIPYLGFGIHGYRHASGLEVVSIVCDDPENVFVAGFRTENLDDTGVQHIVEHVVLGGSRHYQVKSPCDEMGRGSLVTYVNGETYQDRTLYPFASLNANEYLNGIRVYLDAVFHPLLLRETFMQEGWRYEFQKKNGRIVGVASTGIVLNERRAQMNDINDIALTAAYRELLPGHPLSFDAGGTPGSVETLTYEAFLEYYKRHYTLSRCHIYLYGDMPDARKLECIQDYLRTYCREQLSGDGAETRCDCPQEVSPWRRVRHKTIRMESSSAEGGGAVCSFVMNWHLGKLEKPMDAMGFEMLCLLLLEDDGSPLRRAILESGLCEDMLDLDEYETEHSECLFILGAYGCRREDAGRLRALCLECLAECVSKGFAKARIDAAFNQMLLRYREIPNGHGVTLGRQVMRNWLSGLEPILGLDYQGELEELQRAVHDDGAFFQKMIQCLLLENRHRVDICFLEDGALAGQRRRRESRRLMRRWHGMSAQEQLAIMDGLASFTAYQKQTDTPEALEAFPRLKRCELPAVPCDPPSEMQRLANGIAVVRGDMPSPGINYVKLAYDASIFTREELRFLPVFTSLMDAVGAGGRRYGAFEQQLARAGAEIEVDMQSDVAEGSEESLRGTVSIRMDGLAEHWQAAMDCLDMRCRETGFTEKGRMRDVLSQCMSQAKLKLVSDDDALEVAASRANAGISLRETWNELWYGVSGMHTLMECNRMAAGGIGVLQERLMTMMDKLRRTSPQAVSYVGDDVGYGALTDWLSSMAEVRPWGVIPVAEDLREGKLGRREGIDNGRNEFCCVRAFRTFGYNDSLWAPLSVYSELVSEGYLTDTIRALGGAYGGGCSYSAANHSFQMLSYRDPNPDKTLAVFRQALGYCPDWTEGQITGGIVGCIRADVPLRAEECCNVSLWREVIGLEKERRAKRRRQLLAVTLDELREAAEALAEHGRTHWNDCVIGDGRRIEAMGFGLLSR